MEAYDMYIKGFIANLEKHLEGELIGEWITFPISEEELNEVLNALGLEKIIIFVQNAETTWKN